MYNGRATNSIFDDNLNVSGNRSSHAEAKADLAKREIKKLRASLAKSMLISEALWELLRDRAKLTDDDLHKKIYEIDMRDGVLDGKNQRQAVECPDCGRKVSMPPRNTAATGRYPRRS